MSKTAQKITVSLLFGMLLIIVVLSLKVNTFETDTSGEDNNALGSAVTNTSGVQVIDLVAKGGYYPGYITAAANVDTILKVQTRATFDCSSALIIPRLGVRKNLPPTGTTEIPLGTQTPGTKITGTCGMGMYKFDLVFN